MNGLNGQTPGAPSTQTGTTTQRMHSRNIENTRANTETLDTSSFSTTQGSSLVFSYEMTATYASSVKKNIGAALAQVSDVVTKIGRDLPPGSL